MRQRALRLIHRAEKSSPLLPPFFAPLTPRADANGSLGMLQDANHELSSADKVRNGLTVSYLCPSSLFQKFLT
jgi:hypothetical protein